MHFCWQSCHIVSLSLEFSRFFPQKFKFPRVFLEILTIFQIPRVFQVFHVFQVCGHPDQHIITEMGQQKIYTEEDPDWLRHAFGDSQKS